MSPRSRARRTDDHAAPAGAGALAAAIALAVATAAGAVIAVSGARAGEQPLSVPVPPLAPPLAGGPAPDLELLFTAQVIGWIEPCG
jgi:hypothetical protein